MTEEFVLDFPAGRMRCLVYADEFSNITHARFENSVKHCSSIPFPLSFIVGDKAPRQPRLSYPTSATPALTSSPPHHNSPSTPLLPLQPSHASFHFTPPLPAMAPIRRYLRITQYSVLEVRIYLDNPTLAPSWLLHPRNPVLPRVIEAVRPLVLPKLKEENAREGGKAKGRKKGIKDVVVEGIAFKLTFLGLLFRGEQA